MISYKIVQTASGNFRVQRFLNGVTSYVNKGKKKYFKKTEQDSLMSFISELQQNDERKKRLANGNKLGNFRVNI